MGDAVEEARPGGRPADGRTSEPVVGAAPLIPSLTIEPIFGWRSWEVTPRRPGEPGPRAVLRGQWGVAWAGSHHRAGCLRRGARTRTFLGRHGTATRSGNDHEPPALSCRCGVYAYRTRAVAQHDGDGPAWWAPGRIPASPQGPRALGRIALTGIVLEGRRGYRAQRAVIAGALEIELACTGVPDDGEAPCGAAAVAVVRRDAISYRAVCARHVEQLFGLGRPVDVEAWLAAVVPALSARYEVEVVVSLPGVAWPPKVRQNTPEEIDEHR